jgi:hypothetical protein
MCITICVSGTNRRTLSKSGLAFVGSSEQNIQRLRRRLWHEKLLLYFLSELDTLLDRTRLEHQPRRIVDRNTRIHCYLDLIQNMSPAAVNQLVGIALSYQPNSTIYRSQQVLRRLRYQVQCCGKKENCALTRSINVAQVTFISFRFTRP